MRNGRTYRLVSRGALEGNAREDESSEVQPALRALLIRLEEGAIRITPARHGCCVRPE